MWADLRQGMSEFKVRDTDEASFCMTSKRQLKRSCEFEVVLELVNPLGDYSVILEIRITCLSGSPAFLRSLCCSLFSLSLARSLAHLFDHVFHFFLTCQTLEYNCCTFEYFIRQMSQPALCSCKNCCSRLEFSLRTRLQRIVFFFYFLFYFS